MTVPDYREIFAARGDRYHAAMRRHPQARRAEFAQLFAQAPVAPRERVLDLPAGGGYLAHALPETAELVSLELSGGFGAGVEVVDFAAPWRRGRFNHAVCLAALHHIDGQDAFLARLLDVLAPGGTLHLADVVAGSGIARFLDGFVGRYNGTGHTGDYLRPDRARFAALGRVARCEELDCSWVFPDEAAMLDFSGRLFGLVDCPAGALREALHDLVGVRGTADGVALAWRLLYVDLQPGVGGGADL
jgi:SAM-dependent methyltransferase